MASIAENLKRLRKAAKLTQGRLAELSGVSQQLISQIERGENATTRELPALASALHVGVHEIDESFVAVDGDLNVLQVATDDDSKLLLTYRFLGEPDPANDELMRLLAKASPAERKAFLDLLRSRHASPIP